MCVFILLKIVHKLLSLLFCHKLLLGTSSSFLTQRFKKSSRYYRPPCCLKHFENPEHWTLVRTVSFHSNINMVFFFFMCVCVYHVPKERRAVKIALVLPINALSETKSSLSEDKPIICPFCFHKKQEKALVQAELDWNKSQLSGIRGGLWLTGQLSAKGNIYPLTTATYYL